MIKLKQVMSEPVPSLMFISILSWLLVYIFVQLIDFELFISDVSRYWRDANWLTDFGFDLSLIYTAFDIDHAPGYPMLIALLHTILPIIPAVSLMQLINLPATLLSAYYVYQILQTLHVSRPWLGASLFVLFPLVGLTYSVYPIADSLVSLVTVAALLGYFRGNKLMLAVALITGPFIHKVTWPILGIIVLVGLWQRRLEWWLVLVCALPMLIYWYFGYTIADNPYWLLGRYPGFFSQREALPVFDGIIGPLLKDSSLKNWVKSAVVGSVYLLSLWLLITGSWKSQPVLLAVIIPILLWGTFYAGFLIFPIVRFGKFLIIPLWMYLEERRNASRSVMSIDYWFFDNKLSIVGLLSVCLVSQLIWIYYMMLYTSPA